MTFGKALLYFFREGGVSLLRSWKISLVAVATIAVSLILTGTFLMIGSNLSARLADWRAQSRLVIYLDDGAADNVLSTLRSRLEPDPVVQTISVITTEEARTRFTNAFPSMTDLLVGWSETPLPASIEITLAPNGTPADFEGWIAGLRMQPGVAHVDDDRDWLRQMEAAALAVRGLGFVFGTVLLVTSVFTIASVIRLTVYLYQDEIDVMRMVGATEFFIRGPFYLQGLLQGLLGGTVAITILFLGHGLAHARLGDTVAMLILARSFLGLGSLGLLMMLGGGAGLTGAITSLRRERLGSPPTEPTA